MEGKLRLIANPHSEKRMNLILQQIVKNVKHVIENDPLDNDEVSFMYYETSCSCNKRAKCKSTKCDCYVNGRNCNDTCHGQTVSNCTNI